jgi:hypothetical protein
MDFLSKTSIGKRSIAIRDLAWVMAVLVSTSCSAPLPEPSSAQAVRTTCANASNDDYFFAPASVIPSRPNDDLQQRQAYSGYLRAVGLASLSCGEGSAEAYRFLRLTAFRRGIVISVDNNAGDWHLTAAQFLEPLTDPAASPSRIEKSVAEKEIVVLVGSLADAGFWTMPTWKGSDANDGAVWVIEGRKNRGHRVVSVANPSDQSDGAFKTAGRTFVRLAGFTLSDIQ